LEGLRKRAAAARAERSAAAARLTRYRGIAQLAAVLHVLCRDLGARDPRYSLPFVQHAGIFKRALQLTKVATKGTSGTGQRPRSRERLANVGLTDTAAAAAAAGSTQKGGNALAPATAAAAVAADDDELGGPDSEPPAEEMRELELATLRTQVSLVAGWCTFEVDSRMIPS